MIYLELLWSFIQIGMFSIGGGYAAMPLIQNQVVDIHPWLTLQQFADVMAIAEMTPRPHCHQRGNICRYPGSRNPRRHSCHSGLRAALLRHRSDPCLYLLPVPGSYHGTGRTGRSSPRRHCHDRVRRSLSDDPGVLRSAAAACGPAGSGFDRGHHFRRCRICAAQMESQSHLDHGRRRCGRNRAVLNLLNKKPADISSAGFFYY